MVFPNACALTCGGVGLAPRSGHQPTPKVRINMSNRSYLFIAGCPRSGTSALAQLIGAHGSVIIGMERYGHLVDPENFRLTPSHFEKERFTRVAPGDTFYDDFDQGHRWDPAIRGKFGNERYIGDKRPELFLVYDELFRVFDPLTVLFIFRNIRDVASSWNARIDDGTNWPKSFDYRRAVNSWNQSLRLTLRAKSEGKNIICVRYEDMFDRNCDVGPVFDALGLQVDEAVEIRRNKQLRVAQSLSQKRAIGERPSGETLAPTELEYIEKHADYAAEHALDEFNILRGAAGPSV